MRVFMYWAELRNKILLLRLGKKARFLHFFFKTIPAREGAFAVIKSLRRALRFKRLSFMFAVQQYTFRTRNREKIKLHRQRIDYAQVKRSLGGFLLRNLRFRFFAPGHKKNKLSTVRYHFSVTQYASNFDFSSMEDKRQRASFISQSRLQLKRFAKKRWVKYSANL